MSYSGSISRDFQYVGPPEAVISQVLTRSAEFSGLGYRIESHTPQSVVLARSVVADLAYKIPVGLAVLFFLLAMASSSTKSASTLGTFAGISILAALLLALLVRKTERLTLSATPEGGATRIMVSGTATVEMAAWIDGLKSSDVEGGRSLAHEFAPDGP